jgi:hypothetical protein
MLCNRALKVLHVDNTTLPFNLSLAYRVWESDSNALRHSWLSPKRRCTLPTYLQHAKAGRASNFGKHFPTSYA